MLCHCVWELQPSADCVSPHRHRLYQEDCICVQGHYIKDLSILERDLAKTVVLDNAPHTYPYHVSAAETAFQSAAFNRDVRQS